jgi:tRNA 2-thiouridine synthesizing protein A
MEINALGLLCPLPIVHLNRAMKDIPVGEEIVVQADDPAFPMDIKAWCEKCGHTLVSLDTNDPKRLVAVLRKSHG